MHTLSSPLHLSVLENCLDLLRFSYSYFHFHHIPSFSESQEDTEEILEQKPKVEIMEATSEVTFLICCCCCYFSVTGRTARLQGEWPWTNFAEPQGPAIWCELPHSKRPARPTITKQKSRAYGMGMTTMFWILFLSTRLAPLPSPSHLPPSIPTLVSTNISWQEEGVREDMCLTYLTSLTPLRPTLIKSVRQCFSIHFLPLPTLIWTLDQVWFLSTMIYPEY